MFGHFYNKNLRKLVVGFGTMFNSLYVEHANPDDANNPIKIRVPITYAPQEKFIRRLLEPSSIAEGTRIETQLPKLSYIMNNVKVDPSRRRNKVSPIKNANQSAGGDCSSAAESIFEQVPVNVSFTLFIYTRHIDDTLQIAEQIIPYFNPDHIVEIGMNDVQPSIQIPIIMVDNNISEKYDGDLLNRRINISSFSFVAKTFIYGPVRNTTTISGVGDIEIDAE